MLKIRIIGFFFANRLHRQFDVAKNAHKGFFLIRIYLRTDTTVMHNSLYVFDNWEEKLSHKKTLYNYSREMYSGRAKPIG